MDVPLRWGVASGLLGPQFSGMKALLFGSVLCLLAGCNTLADVTNRQVDAVNSAKIATCDRYQACGRIGAGETYENRSDCEANAVSFWNDRWPTASCDGHINGNALEVCTDRIASTDCGSFVDQLSTVYISCAESDVCTD